ncbi:hypothetical protein ATW55_06015 [Ferroacidibacillus organovorans]|uniref:DUF309 domain-containing protein n=1 Tax=Ferroacidibacillus organovorans TaxID=1765683 RepID=A0A101XTT4_9BACL|nr:hypothetical protein ATW55_06015 [Ferroacidibacillus organovorans]
MRDTARSTPRDEGILPLDERLLAYLHCYNIRRDYFLCHEYGESLWLDSGRPEFLKGLIQAAVCLYHLENGNVRGAYPMWLRAKRYVQSIRPVYEAIDIDAMLRDTGRVFDQIPRALFERVVSPQRIADLQLPIVTLRILDPVLLERVNTMTLPPLHGDERLGGDGHDAHHLA